MIKPHFKLLIENGKRMKKNSLKMFLKLRQNIHHHSLCMVNIEIILTKKDS